MFIAAHKKRQEVIEKGGAENDASEKSKKRRRVKVQKDAAGGAKNDVRGNEGSGNGNNTPQKQTGQQKERKNNTPKKQKGQQKQKGKQQKQQGKNQRGQKQKEQPKQQAPQKTNHNSKKRKREDSPPKQNLHPQKKQRTNASNRKGRNTTKSNNNGRYYTDREIEAFAARMKPDDWMHLISVEDLLSEALEKKIKVMRMRREMPRSLFPHARSDESLEEHAKRVLRVCAPCVTPLKDMQLRQGTASEVGVFGHLCTLLTKQYPSHEQLMRYMRCLDRIQDHFAPSVRRTRHTYYVDSITNNPMLNECVSTLTILGSQVKACPKNGEKETYTKTMMTDICLYAAHNPDALIILALHDLKIFANMLNRLKDLKIRILLIVPFNEVDMPQIELIRNLGTYFFNVQSLLTVDNNTDPIQGYDSTKTMENPEVIVLDNEEEDEEEIINLLEDEEENDVPSAESGEDTSAAESEKDGDDGEDAPHEEANGEDNSSVASEEDESDRMELD